MYTLYDAGSNEPIGTLTEAELQFLIDHLEEESATDQDYYINSATVALLDDRGADAKLIGMLRKAMGERNEMDIRWESTAE